MNTYKPGTAVSLTFSLTNQAGEVLTPTALNWRVLNEAETVLQDWTAVATLPITSELTLVIPALITTLDPLVPKGIRIVELEVITVTGTVFLTDTVMLQGITGLMFGVNTFQTYGQALLSSQGFADGQIPGWNATEREGQEKALIEAYNRILRLPIGPHFDNTQSMLTADASYVFNFGSYMLRDMTPDQIAMLYLPMLKDLKMAQFIEADDILNPDSVVAARNNGLTALTVGASSQFFRPTKPLELPICPKAMAQIQRWVRYGARIGRS